MVMRKRILITIGATFACLVLMLYFVSRVILMGSFAELEEQYARRDVERALTALFGELAALDTMVFDWAAWDDTYVFIKDANKEYIASNLVDGTFTSVRLNLMLFVNSSGQIVFGKGFDLDSEEEMPIPEGLWEHLTDDVLLSHSDTESSVTGIVLLPKGPMLVASRPILTSKEEGPIRGTLVMGRYLDSTEVERLAETAQVSLALRQLDDSQMPPDFQAACSSLPALLLKGVPVFVQPLSAGSVAGYTLLRDIYDKPVLVLRVDMPREIYQQGQTSMLYLVSLLLVGGMAFTGMSSLVADRVVISRLIRLNADVNSIGVSGDLSERVPMTGRDELSSLAGAINEMLAALEQAQRRRNRELTTLYEAATAISSDLSLDVVLRTVAEQMTRAFNSSGCALSLWHRERNLVETLVDYNTAWPAETEPPSMTYDLDDYPATRRVLEIGQPMLIQRDDPTADEAELALMREWDAFTLLMLPLIARDRVVGLVELIDDVGARAYTPEEIRLAESLAAQAAVAIENARLYEQAQQEITERKQAEEALRESERRFLDVARTTGDWIWEVDAKGRYVYVSPVVEQVLGYMPEDVLGRHYCDFFHPNDREELETLIQEIFRGKESFVRLLSPNVHKDGHTVVLETTALPLTDAADNLLGYRGTHRDVTVERRLEERLATVYTLGRELVLSGDEQRVIEAVVDAAKLLLRCQLCGLWLVDREGNALLRRAVKAAGQVADVTTVSLDGDQGITVAVAQTGDLIYLPDVSEAPRYMDTGIGSRSELCVPLKVGGRVIGVLNVESERLDAFDQEEQQLFSTLAGQAALAIENARLYEQIRAGRDRLQTLSRRLVEVQEAERRYIARELHDEIGQLLTGLKLVLEMSARLPADAVGDSLDEAQALVNELVAQVRELSLDLRPTMLDDLGLLPALLWHFERYTTQTNIRVVFKHAGLEGQRFAPEVETAAYRIVQEALTNVARHAGVGEVTVRLWADQDALGVQVEDQGSGFDPEAALAAGTSSGLSGMHERAVLLGGQLTIESVPEGGTRLTAEFVLSEPADRGRR